MGNLKPKVAIIGAGNVGTSYAFALMISGIAREIVIVDKDLTRAEGECLDLSHGLSFVQPAAVSAQGFDGCQDADIVVITAGAKQKPGQTRLELIDTNIKLFKQIIPDILKHASNPILLVVTNPVDVLTYVTIKISGLPVNRVIGSGTVLDTSRFRYLISRHCNVDPRNVHAYIIGEHGDTELPVWSNASIGGINIKKFCPHCKNAANCDHEKELASLFDEVKNAAYKIISAKGATSYAVALALTRITEVILRDENSVLPVSTLINGYYGVNDVCLSLPCIVNKNGIEKILKIELSPQEQSQLLHSAQTIGDVVRRYDKGRE